MPGVAPNVSRSALQTDPRDLGALLRQGEALARMNQPEAATETWRRALAVESSSGRRITGSGPAGAGKRQRRGGRGRFHKTADRRPDDRTALNNLGVALDLQGKHPAAQAVYAKLLNLNPSDRQASVNMALSLSLSGQASRSVAMLRGARARPDATPGLRHDLAVALALSGRQRRGGKTAAHGSFILLPPRRHWRDIGRSCNRQMTAADTE